MALGVAVAGSGPGDAAGSARPRRVRAPAAGRLQAIGNLPGMGSARKVAGLPVQAQKSMLACGSAVAPQNSVTLPSRMWLTFATGTSIDLLPREADSVHSATACSSLASTS